MAEYRVNLEIYNGPLDLLLYLIRREEVDIYDIPIARITEQYLQYVELLRQLDPNLAGDFLVLAATLLEIKTRMLLPTPPPEEAAQEGLEIDPRAELVRQLLEYKAFRDAAGDLREAAEARAMKFPRRPAMPQGEEPAIDLEDVQVWDLLDAFSRLLTSIGADKPTHHVIYDDTPIELHQTDILDRLEREGPMTFRRIFEGRIDRVVIVGLFLALLELVRLKRIFATQDANFGEVHIHLNPNPPDMTAAAPPAGQVPQPLAHGPGEYAHAEAQAQGHRDEKPGAADRIEDEDEDENEDEGGAEDELAAELDAIQADVPDEGEIAGEDVALAVDEPSHGGAAPASVTGDEQPIPPPQPPADGPGRYVAEKPQRENDDDAGTADSEARP